MSSSVSDPVRLAPSAPHLEPSFEEAIRSDQTEAVAAQTGATRTDSAFGTRCPRKGQQ
jgi:hypothetical protein